MKVLSSCIAACVISTLGIQAADCADYAPTFDEWYVKISNVAEYRICPTIGPWTMYGFFEGYNGSSTSAITPTIVENNQAMLFDFHDGVVVLNQDYAWASPTMTLCMDLVYREVFDWTSYISGIGPYPYPHYMRLELWAFAEAGPQLVWSQAPSYGLQSGHVDVSFPSYDYIEYRVAFVPEPSALAAVLTLLTGTVSVFAVRRRNGDL